MNKHNRLNSIETNSLGSAIAGKRAVFYEEIAQYSLRYMYFDVNNLGMNVDSEVKYHLNSIIYLSLYFDIILIQTGALFNITDPFVKRVIRKLTSTNLFKEMLKLGLIKICGWGGKTTNEMYSNAIDFASPAVGKLFKCRSFSKSLSNLFIPDYVVYRAEGRPDDEATNAFKSQIYNSEIIRRPEAIGTVEEAILNSENLTGQLTAMGFKPTIEKSNLIPSEVKQIYKVFYQSWLNHMDNTIPNTYMYIANIEPYALTHQIEINGKKVHSFLFSPRIFSLLMSKYFNEKELAKIMGCSFSSFYQLRNGDWQRFRNAYHGAIESVSDSLKDIDLIISPTSDTLNDEYWVSKINLTLLNKESEIDINNYITSLATLSDAMVGMPILGSVVRAGLSIFGKKLDKSFKQISREYSSEISPFIVKTKRYLDNSLALS